MIHDANSGSDSSSSLDSTANSHRQGAWTPEEHERFLVAMTLFPRGPWGDVAQYIGTRTTRQAMAHAQKTNLRQARHARGLKQPGRVAGPNARRRSRSRRQPIASPVNESVTDTKLERLFAEPTSTNTDVGVGSLVALHCHDRHSYRDDETYGNSDWVDDFVRWFDHSEFSFDGCVV